MRNIKKNKSQADKSAEFVTFLYIYKNTVVVFVFQVISKTFLTFVKARDSLCHYKNSLSLLLKTLSTKDSLSRFAF